MLIPRARGPILHPPANPLCSGGSQGHPVLLQGMGQLCRRATSPGRGWEVSPPLSFAGEWLTQVSQKASSQQTALAGLVPFQPRSSAQFPTPTCT